MRILPDSIAGRVGWLLIAGFILTATLTLLVSDWGETSRVLNRIAVTTNIINQLPAANRPDLLAVINEPGQSYIWPVGPITQLSQDFMSHHLARDIRVALDNPKLGPINAGYSTTSSKDAASISPPEVIQVWIRLEDDSWLQIAIDSHRVGALWTLRMLAALIVLAAGLVLLATLVARKVTAPLKHFADAAQTLGTDVNAAPISEAGTSEIRVAAQAFNQMQGRIRRFVEERTLMLAAISHDLKTSLTRLKLRTEFIGDEEQRQKAVADVEEMDTMLAATLQLVRDEANSEPATQVDLAVLLQSLCDDFNDQGKSAGYEGAAHLTFHGHPIALRRLFSNVIDNAIKYGQFAMVRLLTHADVLEVTVEDRGPGIVPEQREQVFEPFFRTDVSRSRETGGSGLGLTVTRTMVRHHGGEIFLETGSLGGLLVRIKLPRSAG